MQDLRWSDIWILVSIYIANTNEETRIRNIIAVADRMNHAIPNVEELESAFVRLKDHQFIRLGKDWAINCTEKGSKVVEEAQKNNSLAYKVCKEIEKKLRVKPWAPPEPIPHPDNNLHYPGFENELYDDELKEYLNLMNKTK